MKEPLKNFVNRCRSCLMQFADDENITPITDFFEIQFYAFTQLELKTDELLSNHVCEYCHGELIRFSVFKKDLIEKQLKLYDLLKQHNHKVKQMEINGTEYSKNSENDLEDDDDDDEMSEISETPSSSEHESDVDYKLNDRSFKTKSPALNISSITSAEKLVCDYCNLTFKAKQGLVRHVQAHLDMSPTKRRVYPFKCNVCNFSSNSKAKLSMHKTRHHKIIKKDKTYIIKRAHEISNKIPTGRFKCFCGVFFETRRSLQSHRARRHGSLNKCNFGCANLRFPTTGEWIRHVRSSHPSFENECLQMVNANKTNEWYTEIKEDEKILCTKCDFEASDIDILTRHNQTIHENGKVECVECFKLFANSTSLRMHINTIHREIRKFQCPKCESSFKQHVHLKEHMIGVHKILSKNINEEENIDIKVNDIKKPIIQSLPYVCECSKEFTYRSRMLAHQNSCRVHRDRVSPKVISVASNESLTSLKNIVKAATIHKCLKCPRQFAHRSNLLRHQKLFNHLSSEDIKNLKFNCAKCGEKFFNRRGLLGHERRQPECEAGGK